MNASFEKHIRMCRRLNWFIVALISCLVCDLMGFQKLTFCFYKARRRGRMGLPGFRSDPTVGKLQGIKVGEGWDNPPSRKRPGPGDVVAWGPQGT